MISCHHSWACISKARFDSCLRSPVLCNSCQPQAMKHRPQTGRQESILPSSITLTSQPVCSAGVFSGISDVSQQRPHRITLQQSRGTIHVRSLGKARQKTVTTGLRLLVGPFSCRTLSPNTSKGIKYRRSVRYLSVVQAIHDEGSRTISFPAGLHGDSACDVPVRRRIRVWAAHHRVLSCCSVRG